MHKVTFACIWPTPWTKELPRYEVLFSHTDVPNCSVALRTEVSNEVMEILRNGNLPQVYEIIKEYLRTV